MDPGVLAKLKYGSTWKLLGLGIITYGIYFAYYIRRQSNAINELEFPQQKVPELFVSVFRVLSYVSAVLFLLLLWVTPAESDDFQQVYQVGDCSDLAWGVMLLFWGFMARNRVNSAFALDSRRQGRLGILGTLLLSPLYFNYKINRLCQLQAGEQPASASGIATDPE